VDGRRPAELGARLRGVAQQVLHLRGPQQVRIAQDIFLIIQADAGECDLDELLNGMTDARRDHVIVGPILLQHQPHGAHVVAGKTPVALRLQIADGQRVGEPQFDAGRQVRDLTRDELQAAARRLVVEEHSGHGEQVVALPVVHGNVVSEDLRHAIRTARVERRFLRLRNLTDLPEHLAG
jgi:hypothetical protein